jgi:hypothetical protein
LLDEDRQQPPNTSSGQIFGADRDVALRLGRHDLERQLFEVAGASSCSLAIVGSTMIPSYECANVTSSDKARWANCTCRKKRSTRKYGNVNGDEFAKRAIPIDPDFSDQNTRSTIIDRIIEIVDRFVSTTVGRR